MGVRGLAVRLLTRAVVRIVQARGRAIRPGGQAALFNLAESVIRARQRLVVSDQIGILAGFELDVRAEESVLAAIGASKNPQVLAVVNHFADCPLGVVANAVLAAHGLRTTLGLEPTIIFGMGASVVTLLRDRASRITDIVMVGGLRITIGGWKLLDLRKSSSVEILGRLRTGESVLIYPEKKNSSALLPGDFRSGRVILHCAELGVPIVPVAIYFQDGTFHMSVGRCLDRSQILALAAHNCDKQLSGQSIVDYAMAEIARQLPESLRGPYPQQQPALLAPITR